jgi:hypothetical protein
MTFRIKVTLEGYSRAIAKFRVRLQSNGMLNLQSLNMCVFKVWVKTHYYKPLPKRFVGSY